jgi:DNA-binding transcriptional LysR family regulator
MNRPTPTRQELPKNHTASAPTTTEPAVPTYRLHRSGAETPGRRRTPRVLVQQYDTLLSLVAGGHGIAVVPGSVIGRLPTGVEVRPVDEPRLRRHVGVVHRTGQPRSRLARAFVTALAEEAAERPGIDVGSGGTSIPSS